MLMRGAAGTGRVTLGNEKVPTITRPELGGRVGFSLQEVISSWLFVGNEGQGTKNTVAGIYKNTPSSKYYAVTLTHFQRGEFHTIREKFHSFPPQAADIANDIYNSTLILLGVTGSKTGLHLDWTEAFNIAFEFGQPGTLAVWVLFHPSIVGELDAWLKAHGRPHGLATAGKAHLSTEEMETLRGVFGEKMVVLEQKGGDMVFVPPGWVHQVTNLQPCLKVAWDTYDARHYEQYCLLHRRIACKYFGSTMADDYMSFNLLLWAMM